MSSKLSALSKASLATLANASNIHIAGYDLTRSFGDQNVTVSAADLITLAVSQAGATGGASGVTTQTLVTTGIITAPGASATHLLYAPITGDTNDVLIFYVNFSIATIAGGTMVYQLWAGNPSTTGSKVIYTSPQISGFSYTQPLNILIPYSSGTNQVYIEVFNKGASGIVLNMQVSAMELPSAGQILASYTPPAAYTGPLLANVYVTPGDPTFPEPVYAVRALADGGTMHIDTGIYYMPFGMFSLTALPSGSTFDMSPKTVNPITGATIGGYDIELGAAGTATHGFTNFMIKGNGAYNTIFNGRHGGGAGHRMMYGKTFIEVQVPGTIQDCGFVSCGGIWPALEGAGGGGPESGIFAEGFVTEGTLTVLRCSFDDCCNGISTEYPGNQGPNQSNVDMVIDTCDFGLRSSNGSEGSGFAHNFYVKNKNLTVRNSNMYGIDSAQLNINGLAKAGNSFKSRADSTTITNCWIQCNNGNLNIPSGGNLTVSNTTICSAADATLNYYNYANENVLKGAYNQTFTNVTFNISRYQTLIQVAHNIMVCSGCTQNYYTVNGSQQATLQLNTSGDGGGYNAALVSGLTFAIPSPFPTTALPAAPGSVAQPGYVPSWPF